MIKRSLLLAVFILIALVALGRYDNTHLSTAYRLLVGSVIGAFAYSLLYAIRKGK